MTPEDFRKIRVWAEFSVPELASALQVDRRTIQRYETGSLKIPGPVSVLMDLIDKYNDVLESLRHEPKPRG